MTNNENGHTADNPNPPPGVRAVEAKVCIGAYCARCQAPIVRFSRKTWFPVDVDPQALMFKNVDPEDRLDAIGGVGIALPNRIVVKEWDYAEQRLNVYLHPIVLHPALNDEHVGLFVGLMKDGGWSFESEDARKWAERWKEHHLDMTPEQIAATGQPIMVCVHGPGPKPGQDKPAAVHSHGGHPQGAPQVGNDEDWGEDADPDDYDDDDDEGEAEHREKQFQLSLEAEVEYVLGKKGLKKFLKKREQRDAEEARRRQDKRRRQG